MNNSKLNIQNKKIKYKYSKYVNPIGKHANLRKSHNITRDPRRVRARSKRIRVD